MLETDEELARLQGVLDASFAAAGAHLRGIYADARMSAADLARRMSGMCLLTLATVAADGRPIAGAVDGYLLHGDLWFGSAETAVRTRHLRRNPAVSATWLPDPYTQFTVHGDIEIVPFDDDRVAPLRQAMADHYVPTEGTEWLGFLDALQRDRSPAFRISPRKAFGYYRPPTADPSPADQGTGGR